MDRMDIPARTTVVGSGVLLCLILLAPTGTTAFTPEQEAWLEDDSEQRARDVNEGELTFLPGPPDPKALHSASRLAITVRSIDTGWVDLEQCYRNLDAVPEMQVVYQYKQLRNLQLLSARNIGKAWLDGQSVQLEDVGHDATLCIRARVRIFYQNPDRTFSLINGPFHRRFLDGYYPYHVTLRISYPATQLEFLTTRPPARPGFAIQQ
ncbi:MAG TPA: hypothetical protein EYP40_09420, partial [Chromatiales bacterium]|nr:hypothetical protein [Chromatiales bacterium]